MNYYKMKEKRVLQKLISFPRSPKKNMQLKKFLSCTCNLSFWPLSYILFHNNNKAFECSQKKRKKKMNGFGGLACMHHEPNFKLVPCDFLDLQVAILYLPSGSLLMHGLVLTKVLSTF